MTNRSVRSGIKIGRFQIPYYDTIFGLNDSNPVFLNEVSVLYAPGKGSESYRAAFFVLRQWGGTVLKARPDTRLP